VSTRQRVLDGGISFPSLVATSRGERRHHCFQSRSRQRRVAPPASHTRKRRHVVLAVALVTSDAACGNRTHDLRTTRARLTWARSCCRRLLSHPTRDPSPIMPIMSGTIEDSEIVDVNTQRVSCHVGVTPTGGRSSTAAFAQLREPPVGIEPTTYALRGCRETAHRAPPAPIARPTALRPPRNPGEHVSCPTACPTTSRQAQPMP
jgi:hypothetical protein